MKMNEKIILKKLNLNKDITKKYQNWMNSLEIHKYTEQKNKKHSLTNIKNFVIEKNKSKNEFLSGIFLKKKNLNTHIGNIKLGPISIIHKTANISYFIGVKELWNKGYTTLAIKEIIKIAKKKVVKKPQEEKLKKKIDKKKIIIKIVIKMKGKIKSK